jgi:solute carrier family 7 (cationic amino acid transporter), member 3
VSVGEFVAFTIGWNLILEYVIGTSSVARGLSGYIDSLIDDRMGKFWRNLFPIDIDFLAEYPDFFSFVIVLVLASVLAFGVKESSFLNNIFTVVNLITVAIVLVAGTIKADPSNWAIAKEDIPEGVRGGEGGFMPYGVAGVMAGAAKCFYGFVGFDCVATTGEEAKNPKRNIPLAIVISLIIIFFAYFGISTVLTMMWPYYAQNPIAPFPHVFQELGMIEIKWIVTVGAIFALCTSLLGAMVSFILDFEC